MNYIKAILFITFFAILFLFFSCEKGSEPEKIEPSSRDFIWTEDTLETEDGDFYSFKHIVGNTSNDVWLGTDVAPTESTGLWHYDGIKWRTVPKPTMPNLSFETTALYIFEDNTLFIGNFGNQISKRENGEWTETFELSVDGFQRMAIFDIYGRSKDNIFAIGVAYNYATDSSPYKQIGVIFHYDGVKWDNIEISEFGGAFHIIKYDWSSKKYLISVSRGQHGNFEDIYLSFDGINIKELSQIDGRTGISDINGELYFNLDRKVYKIRNDTPYLWKDFSGTEFLTNFVGDSESNFFNHSSKGIGHYNGVDYKTIYETDLELQSLGFVGNDIFVVGVDYSNRKYIVIHGVLKNK